MTTQETDYAEGVRERVHRLHDLRLAHKNTKELLAEAKKKWEQANWEMLADEAKLSQELKAMEDHLRDYALAGHRVTGETKFPGVEIKKFTVLDYQADDALAWAKENARIFVLPESLDTKGVERYLKNMAEREPFNLPFLTVREEPRAQIASDLSKIVEVE